MKKLLSILLVLIIVISCFSVVASSAGMNYKRYNGFVYSDFDAKDGYVIITNYKGSKERVTIPTKIKGKKVQCMTHYGKIKYLHIPDGVEALYIAKAKNLKKVTVSKTHKKYTVKNNLLLNKKKTILYGCPRANTNPKIPKSVKVIASDAFFGAKIKSIKLPNKVKRIETRAFSDCKNLKKITFNKGLKKIGNQAFWKCKNLTSVVIPNSVTQIGSFAFSFCDKLESVKLSNKLKTLSDSFMNCKSLKMLKVPKSVEKIAGEALQCCDSLEKVYIYNPKCKLTIDTDDPLWNSIPETVTIYGYKNSTAQKYAKKIGNKFIELQK